MLVHRRVTPIINLPGSPIHLGEGRHCESKVSCPKHNTVALARGKITTSLRLPSRPDYFTPYIHYLKDTHNYNTKATTKNNLVLPKCKRISGCRTFHTSATRLWNNVDVSIRDRTSHKQFAGKVRQKLLKQNATLEHFVISSTF